jgi:tetratricopeptide (TPR) repeat protein
MRVPRPEKRPFLITGGLILLAGFSGCQGRAEFHRGAEFYRRGEYRDAYYQYWQAYNLSPSTAHLEALRLAGRGVGREERAHAVEAEASGDLDRALEAYSLALEYDPAAPELIEGYSRVFGLIEEWDELEWELLSARLAPPADPWREFDVLQAMSEHPSFSVAWEDDLAVAASRAAGVAADALRLHTFEGSLPAERELLDRIEDEWLRLLGRLWAEAEREEADAASGDPIRREVASWGVVRKALATPAEEALDALAMIARTREGIAWREHGLELEREGDLAGAMDAFERAALRNAAITGAIEDAGRARRLLTAALYREALLAARAEEWRRAAASLERLLGKDPGNRDALVLLGTCREKVAASYLDQARGFEDAGLPSNALVRCHLALAWDPACREAEKTLKRLEWDLEERLHPGWRVVLRSEDDRERRSRRELWGVGEDSLRRLERTLVESTQVALDASSRGRSSHEIVLRIEDLDFSCPLGESSRGAETTRFVESIATIENPDLVRAKAGVEAARALLDAAEEREQAAPLRKEALASSRARIARLFLAQAETTLEALPAHIPEVRWGTSSHRTDIGATRAELACRYLAEGESRWVSASLEIQDRVVAGDPERGVPPDPEEGPSRREVLRVLGDRLAREMALDAGRLHFDRQEGQYLEALASIEGLAFERAVEDLVAFLYSRRADLDSLRVDAARRLEDLTGLNLPAAWAAARAR